MSDLIIYGFAPSTYVQSARLSCVEKGVDHRLEPLAFKSDAHRALHPFGKMPVLQHGDVRVFETAAILGYVDERFEGPPLLPLGPRGVVARAHARQWMSAAADALYPVVGALAGHDEPLTDTGRAQLAGALAVFDAALREQPFLSGERLGLADLYVLPMVRFARRDARARALFEVLPALGEWCDALAARPGYAEVLS